MAIQEQLHTVDSVQHLARTPEFNRRRFYLIDGELFEMSPVQRVHSRLASRIDRIIGMHVEERDLGEVHVELGFYPADDRSTLLAPDVAYVSHARLSGQPEDGFLSTMPDLAIEIVSPSNSLRQIRRKAQIYLEYGASLVWIVRPAEKGVDVCRAADSSRLDIEFVARDGLLSGEDVLPGFELELTQLFRESAGS